jgi:hypothetical protein
MERMNLMELIDKVLEANDNLYFVEGFYGNHYLITMSPAISEVKLPYELLNLLKISHDERLSIGDAFKKVLGNNGKSEDLKQLSKQISWLNEKGMINLI